MLVVVRMGRFSTMLAIAAAALVVAVAPAQAGEVIVVSGHHAKRVDDPTVPSKASIDLPRGGGAVAAASAARAAKPRADRRAVYRALKRALRSKRATAGQVK